MIKLYQTATLLTAVFLMLSFQAAAQTRTETRVTVVHASTESNRVDPGLSAIISELRSVFRYTSYRLVTSQDMNLAFNQEGRVNLPGGRRLVITPLGMDGQRISYQVNVLKNKRSVFQTRILLRNNASVTIGGPQFNRGVILFNIRGRLR